jgi:hypothetical protein
MREVIIQQVGLCSSGRLRLRPTRSRPSGYNYIWRDASSVRWDDVTSELYVHVVSEFTLQDEFKLMIAAVAREYGDQLILSPATVYVDLPSDMVTALRETTA